MTTDGFATLRIANLHVKVWGKGSIPAIVFHGGPGSGLNTGHARYFEAGTHRVIMFDQRGIGLSAGAITLTKNTTEHTLQDAETIREALGIDRWIVLGGSWGGALALRYAASYPHRSLGLVVRSSLISRERLERWMFHKRPKQFKEGRHALEQFLDPLDEVERMAPIAAWFARLSDCQEQALEAARRVGALEAAFHGPKPSAVGRGPTPQEADLPRIKVYLWYWMNSFYLPRQWPAEPKKIAALPHSIIHGQNDLICPIGDTRDYCESDDLNLLELNGAGHDAFAPLMVDAVRKAVSQYSNV